MYPYLKALVQWRKFIIASGFGAAVIAAIISLLLPKWYTATTSVFPPETKSALSPYAQFLQDLQAPILGPTAIGARPGTIYIDILKSRKVGEQIIKQFDYMKIYKADLMTDALDILHKHTYFSLLENGLLMVSFEDTDAKRAAEVTNKYVELLDKFNREMNITQASKKKEFIAKQLEIHKKELKRVEEALKEFQKENQTVDISAQTSAAINIVADLTSKAVALEIDLDLLRYYTSTNSDEYKRKKKNYDELIKQLKEFKFDSARTGNDTVKSFFPALNEIPDVSLEYARRLRDVRVEEKVYQLLITEYEQARIEEARDTPTVQILDTASPPELRSRPKRKQIVFIGGILGLAWASLIAIFSSILSDKVGEGSAIRELLDPIIADMRRIFHRNKK